MNDKINILNKVGMLSIEDRKQPLTHECDYFKFESNIDLSEGVKVINIGGWYNLGFMIGIGGLSFAK